MKELRVPYPDSIEQALQLNPEEIASEILLTAALKMYELGKLSIENAAALAGLPGVEFLAACRRHHVTVTAVMPGLAPADEIPAVLRRPEALRLIELLECQELQVLLEEPATLLLFADLVSEGVVSVKNGQLVITPLGKRQIENLVNLEYAKFLK